MVWTAGYQLQNGKYRIEEMLGQGGFGITYKAWHGRLKKPVVIKTPNESLRHNPDYDTYVERFIKEGQRLAQLPEHPHIVRVWDLTEEGNIPYMVMDFVPGENLFQLVRRRGALPEAEIVPYIWQIGTALMVVHQAGLVHRDAHPGNIIIRPDRKAILIDFGIAKELIPSTQSSTGKAGNKDFAPYEQILRGSRGPTVDIYCLAATLYFAATGQSPATSLDRRLQDTHLISPKQLQPEISDQLNQAILQGMALEAAERPQSMQSWLSLLGASKVSASSVSLAPPTNRSRPPTVVPVLPTRSQSRSEKNPWSWLTVVVLSYSALNASLYASSASVWTVAVAAAMAGTWAVVSAVVWVVVGAGPRAGGLAGAGAWIWGVAWAVAMAQEDVAVTWTWALVWALVGAVAWGGVVGRAWAMAGADLLVFFSKFNTALILAGASILGSGLGWLVVMALHLSIN